MNRSQTSLPEPIRFRSWLALLLVLLSATFLPAQGPSIVFVLADDHAFEAISAYESYLKDHAKTPTIDRLANEGMLLDNFVCCNSICSPSRAAILTGQYSHRNGVKGLNGRINDSSPQYPQLLQSAGYQTWLVGKWHLSSQPQGYDKYMVVKGQGSYFDPTFNGTEGTWKRRGYSTDVYTNIAMDWLENRDREKPFCLCLQFKAPHHDYGHHQRYDKLLADISIPEPPTLYEDIDNGDSNLKKLFLHNTKFHMLHSGGNITKPRKAKENSYYARHLNDASPNQMWPHDAKNDKDRIRVAYQHMLHKYIRCISGNDDNLKRVLDYLDAEDLTENTIVIYTSDQGYWLGQHGFYDKRLALETSIRMPFLIRYPKLIKPGTRNSDLCINVDIAPTLLELAGIEAPQAMQGRSMVPLLKGISPDDWRTSQFYSYWAGPDHYGLRTKRYTYVKSKSFPPELFDRQTDPDQRTNLGGKPEYEGVMQKLEADLENLIKEVGIEPQDIPGARRK